MRAVRGRALAACAAVVAAAALWAGAVGGRGDGPATRPAHAAEEGADATVRWRRDVDAAFAEARERNAPVFAVFRCET